METELNKCEFPLRFPSLKETGEPISLRARSGHLVQRQWRPREQGPGAHSDQSWTLAPPGPGSGVRAPRSLLRASGRFTITAESTVTLVSRAHLLPDTSPSLISFNPPLDPSSPGGDCSGPHTADKFLEGEQLAQDDVAGQRPDSQGLLVCVDSDNLREACTQWALVKAHLLRPGRPGVGPRCVGTWDDR